MTIKIGKLTECFAILPTLNLNWFKTSKGTIYYLQLGWIFWYIDITMNKFIKF